MERDGEPTLVVSKYYYLNGQRIAKTVDGVLNWIHSDHLHSATILTDAGGAELRRLAYRAFGEEAENVGSGTELTYSYTGPSTLLRAGPRDSSGLMYYGARYYDPALSRFITADTVYDRGPQGLNRYSYALNNPIRYNDPSGHAADSPQYFCESPYDLLPYAGEVDSGNDVVDHAGALLGGMYNFGAGVANALLGGAAAGEELVEAGYNAGTEAVLGTKGFTGEGFEGDLFALESSGLPAGASLAQGIAPLLKGKLAELGKSLGKTLTSEAGSAYIGENSKTAKKASDLQLIKKGTKEWDQAVEELSLMKKGKRGKMNIRVENASDAKELLKDSKGNMNRYKQYKYDELHYSKGYEMHMHQSSRELGVGNDLPHLKWHDNRTSGHIFFDTSN